MEVLVSEMSQGVVGGFDEVGEGDGKMVEVKD